MQKRMEYEKRYKEHNDTLHARKPTKRLAMNTNLEKATVTLKIRPELDGGRRLKIARKPTSRPMHALKS